MSREEDLEKQLAECRRCRELVIDRMDTCTKADDKLASQRYMPIANRVKSISQDRMKTGKWGDTQDRNYNTTMILLGEFAMQTVLGADILELIKNV